MKGIPGQGKVYQDKERYTRTRKGIPGKGKEYQYK